MSTRINVWFAIPDIDPYRGTSAKETSQVLIEDDNHELDECQVEIDTLLQSKLKMTPREKLDPEDILGELSNSMQVDKTEFMKRVYRELTGAQS